MNDHATQPLSSFSIFERAEPDELAAFADEQFCPDSVQAISAGDQNWINYLELDGASLSFGDFECGLDLSIGEDCSMHKVVLAIRGVSEIVASGRHYACTRSHGLVRTGEQSGQWRHGAGSANLYFDVGVNTMKRHYRTLTNEEMSHPIEFKFELASDAVTALMHSVSTQANSCTEILEFPILRSQFSEMLIHCFLLQQPSNYSTRLRRSVSNEPPAKQRIAEEYMRANVDRPITMGDVAVAAGMSVRSLTRSYQRYRSVSPREFLQQLRLEDAHKLLLRAEAYGSVTKIALDCGFGHLGRFSSYYFNRFGEMPSETLRRVQVPSGLD